MPVKVTRSPSPNAAASFMYASRYTPSPTRTNCTSSLCELTRLAISRKSLIPFAGIIIVARARSGQLPEALNQIEEILRTRRNVKFSEPNNFDVKTADAFITQFDSIFGMIGLIAIAISSVGLMVGGIGVMNIMLVSVTERTAEIGVRKALGARRRDITSQFLFEAMTLTFLGGVIGVLTAIGISKLIGLIIPSLPSSIPTWAVTTGLTVSVAVGLIFGVWPARKAARLDLIECLRYE